MQTDKERANPYEEGIQTAIDAALAMTWTALVGQIVAFDASDDKQTATIAPSVQAVVTAPDGTRSLVTMPLLLDCPVYFPEGGGAVLTFPIQPGDECLVVFADRCIDSWWQQGGIQPPAEFRMHDLSDGMAYVGFRSVPNNIPTLSTVETQLRSTDGATVIGLNPNTGAVTITAPGNLIINADVVINGTVNATGNIETPADVIAGNISLKTHKTSAVTPGGGLSGNPVP